MKKVSGKEVKKAGKEKDLPKELLLLPINEKPVFPGIVVPLIFNIEEHGETLEEAIQKRKGYIGISLVKSNTSKSLKKKETNNFYKIGCMGRISKIIPISVRELQVVISFSKKIQIGKVTRKNNKCIVKVEYIQEIETNDQEVQGYILALISKLKELANFNSTFSEEMKIFLNSSRYIMDSPNYFSNIISGILTTPTKKELQELLEIQETKEKINKVLSYVYKEIELLKVKEKINKKVESEVSKNQRNFFLKEQLKYIKKELGSEIDEKTIFLKKIAGKIKLLKLPKETKKVIEEEIEKIKVYDPRGSEYGVSKNYLDWLVAIPWGKNSKEEEEKDLKEVKKALDKNYYGLEKVKQRILEFFAVETIVKEGTGSIICLVGPPGVGKTALGKTCADALKRPFFRFSVGGMRDESEIKGHRRTYVGAMPGKFLQALKKTQSMRPIILLDEIDKLSKSYQGDPASALLEVLDPEQNHHFLDHYLDVPVDLSQVLFLTTANQIDTIPLPLIDRMEVIEMNGYITEEKKHIAKKHLIPKQIKKHGLKSNEIKFNSEIIEEIILFYGREAGVRKLEQQIKTILRKVILEKVIEEKANQKIFEINKKNLSNYLGIPKFNDDDFYKELLPGIVCGLAWTSLGGKILYIEALKIEVKEKNGSLKLTGQLGKVMQESAEIAYSFVKSIAVKQRISKGFFSNSLIHLHVPEGSTPKDGPSAGISIALALISLATEKPVSNLLALTGELTLTGKVLAIGGLREKLSAANRAGKKEIIIPESNRKEISEIPKVILKGLKLHFVSHFEEVLQVTLNIK